MAWAKRSQRWINAVHKALKERGWTKAEASRHLGVPRSNLGRWLNGERTPEAATAFKIERVLGVPARLLADAA